MPRRHVSRDLKQRIPSLHYEHKLPVKKICQYLGVKKSLVYATLAHHHVSGVPYNPGTLHMHRGRPSIFSPDDKAYIARAVIHHGAIYLDELQAKLSEHRGVSASITSIWRVLQRLNFTHKAVTKHAIERNEVVCAAFKNSIALLAPDPEMFIFLDESARDERTNSRRFGWSLKGTPFFQQQVFIRGARVSILPALTLDGIIAYDLIDGSVTAERFGQFLREMVVSFSLEIFYAPYSLCSYRCHLRTPTLELGVCWSWTTATYTVPIQYVFLLRMNTVSGTSSFDIAYSQVCRVQTCILTTVLSRSQPNRTRIRIYQGFPPSAQQ